MGYNYLYMINFHSGFLKLLFKLGHGWTLASNMELIIVIHAIVLKDLYYIRGVCGVVVTLCLQYVQATGVLCNIPDSKVPGANMGPTWFRQTQVGPMLAPRTLLSGIISQVSLL